MSAFLSRPPDLVPLRPRLAAVLLPGVACYSVRWQCQCAKNNVTTSARPDLSETIDAWKNDPPRVDKSELPVARRSLIASRT